MTEMLLGMKCYFTSTYFVVTTIVAVVLSIVFAKNVDNV